MMPYPVHISISHVGIFMRKIIWLESNRNLCNYDTYLRQEWICCMQMHEKVDICTESTFRQHVYCLRRTLATEVAPKSTGAEAVLLLRLYRRIVVPALNSFLLHLQSRFNIAVSVKPAQQRLLQNKPVQRRSSSSVNEMSWQIGREL